jgi:hypothetical protein
LEVNFNQTGSIFTFNNSKEKKKDSKKEKKVIQKPGEG